jgi:hypothetical protein
MAGERIEELKRRVDEQREALKSLAESLEGEDRGGTFSKIKLAFNKTSDKIKNPLKFFHALFPLRGLCFWRIQGTLCVMFRFRSARVSGISCQATPSAVGLKQPLQYAFLPPFARISVH